MLDNLDDLDLNEDTWEQLDEYGRALHERLSSDAYGVAIASLDAIREDLLAAHLGPEQESARGWGHGGHGSAAVYKIVSIASDDGFAGLATASFAMGPVAESSLA